MGGGGGGWCVWGGGGGGGGGGGLDNHFLLTIDMQLNHMYIHKIQ